MTESVACGPVKQCQTEMDIQNIISYHPHPHRSLLKKSLSFCSPSCDALVVTIVSVFLPSSVPDAGMIKALNVRESTQKDSWRDGAAKVPGEIKRSRDLEEGGGAGPSSWPRRDHMMSREVELGCESWTSFASSCSSAAVQRTLSL